jgi:hypothetical protein
MKYTEEQIDELVTRYSIRSEEANRMRGEIDRLKRQVKGLQQHILTEAISRLVDCCEGWNSKGAGTERVGLPSLSDEADQKEQGHQAAPGIEGAQRERTDGQVS